MAGWVATPGNPWQPPATTATLTVACPATVPPGGIAVSRLLALAVVCLIVPAVSARPPHKQALAQHLGPYLPAKLNACTTCHLPDAPGAAEGEKPHNDFGARLAEVRRELRKAGRKYDIPSCLDAIADEDSDGDGTPN